MNHRLATFLLFLVLAATRLAAQFTIDTVSYHGVTAAAHQLQTTNLSGQGYRPISLAVAGGLANARYSAVWQRTGGPTWVMVHGMPLWQYQAQATTWAGQGYRAKLVAASGTNADVVFAAMWVRDTVDATHDEDLPAYHFDSRLDAERTAGRRLVSCATYVYNNGTRHAVVFEPDDSGIAWGAWTSDDAAAFAHKFGEHSLGGERPTFLSVADNQTYSHVWRDDRIGGWAVVSDRTSAQFAADKTTYENQGLALVCIGAGGAGSAARYAGLFVARLTPYARSMSRSGQFLLGMAGFDTYIENLMQQHMVRNASLAVARHGRLVYARGYTYAEPGHPQTLPTTPFRLGSISKPLCGTLVHDLIDEGVGGLTLDTSMVGYLGLTNYATGATNATVRRLLRHTAGMIGEFDEITAAQALSGGLILLPPDERLIVRYGAMQPWTAVDHWDYSNCGNTALGQMVEQATGLSYMTALRNRLFLPAGTNDLYQQTPRPQNFAPGEASYHVPELFLQSANLYLDRRLLSPQHAQEFWDSAGGVVTSAVALARVVSAAFCIRDDSPILSSAARARAMVRNTFPRTSGSGTRNWSDGSWEWSDLGNGRVLFQHNGKANGTATRCLWTTDGLCIVALTNMTEAMPDHNDLLAAADAVTAWPTHDLFPSFGMPSFPRTPYLEVPSIASVPNVSDAAYVFDGEGLDQVVSVDFGNHTIASQSPNTWHDGWFTKVSPTRLEVHPPQGLVPGSYTVRARSFQGAGNGRAVLLTRATQFAVKTPDTVNGAQTFAAIVSRGPTGTGSFVVLGFSTDQVPTVLPGLVNLGIGNQFTSLWTSDTRTFSLLSSTARWDFPALGTLPQLHFQCAVLDPALPSPLPLTVTPVETTTRVP